MPDDSIRLSTLRSFFIDFYDERSLRHRSSPSVPENSPEGSVLFFKIAFVASVADSEASMGEQEGRLRKEQRA